MARFFCLAIMHSGDQLCKRLSEIIPKMEHLFNEKVNQTSSVNDNFAFDFCFLKTLLSN